MKLRVTVRKHPSHLSLLCYGLSLVLWQFSCRPIFAHRLHLFVFQEQGEIRGQAYFQDGTPLRSGKVQILDSKQTAVAETVTNEKGEFSFPAPPPGKYTLSVDAGFGHVAQQELDIGLEGHFLIGAQSPAAAARSEDSPNPGKGEASDSGREPGLNELAQQLVAVKSELALLRAAIEREATRSRVQDIVGGAGYVVGVIALLYLVKSFAARSAKR